MDSGSTAVDLELPGTSCKHPGGRRGTAGATVWDVDGTRYVLGNSHVFAPTMNARLGDRIALASGLPGWLTRASKLTFYGGDDRKRFNTVDAALLRIPKEGSIGEDELPDKLHPPGPGIVDEALLFVLLWHNHQIRVTKFGATTDRTYGEVECINFPVNVNGAWFRKQILIKPQSSGASDPARTFAAPGDSGSLVVSDLGGKIEKADLKDFDSLPVGLVFASRADGSAVFANPIEEVFSCLGVAIPDKSGDKSFPTYQKCEHPFFIESD